MSIDSALLRCRHASQRGGLRRCRCPGFIGLCLLSICGLAQTAVSQTLNLGDPKPPQASEIVGCRQQAERLRRESGAMRAPASTGDDAARICIAARVKWREIASLLLEQSDPLENAEIVMLGWMLAEQGEELDRLIESLASGAELTQEQRADALWELKRFVAMPLRLREADPAARAAQPTAPVDVTEIRIAIRPLVEALTSVAGSPPLANASLTQRLAAAGSLIADDPDLVPLRATLDRFSELRTHPGWMNEAEMALSECLDLVDDVRVLDGTPWLGAVWTPFRSDQVARSIERLAASRDEVGQGAAVDLSEIAACVEAVNELLRLPPRSRPQLDPFRKVIVRWVGEALSTNQRRSWPLLAQALASMGRRCADASTVSQHELRIACNALDEQSDRLERLMAECLNRQSLASQSSDPEWATVVGQHRENVRAKQMLSELPDAIDWLAPFDRRAASSIWPRLLPDARAIDDQRSRESLLNQAAEIVAFKSQFSSLPSEAEWRRGERTVSAVVGSQRERILAQLDALRKARSGEIVASNSTAATRTQLDAMRDLFRLVEVERLLQSAGAAGASSGMLGGIGIPPGFMARERSRFEASLQSLLNAAPAGGVQFTRAADAARRDAASAIVLTYLVERNLTEPEGSTPTLQSLAAIARFSRRDDSAGAVSRNRLARWSVLQFEIARQSDDGGDVSADLTAYARFLTARIAEAIWAESR